MAKIKWNRLRLGKIKSNSVTAGTNGQLSDSETSPEGQAPCRAKPNPRGLFGLSVKLRGRLAGQFNSIALIKIRMLIVAMVCFGAVEAGFFSFYFPNIFKPKGFDELTEMITGLDDQINATLDHFADIQYFWGLLQKLDETPIENNYPENSACKEIFPAFRDLAIEYVFIDLEFYLEPMEAHRDYLIAFRDEWYPAEYESRAALPREWEQKLLEEELQLKINKMEQLANEKEYKEKREKLVEIWKNIRRNLDDSVECVYLRYAYRHIAEDINQLALEMNLESLRYAMTVLKRAYKRIAKYKNSDEKIIQAIEDDIERNERFTIDE